MQADVPAQGQLFLAVVALFKDEVFFRDGKKAFDTSVDDFIRPGTVFTLEPCDLIATGTPAGVGFAMKPEAQFLNIGDAVEIEIQNIGQLRNKIGQ